MNDKAIKTKAIPGQVSSYYVSGDEKNLVIKESSQFTDPRFDNAPYIPPPVSPDVVCTLFEQNPFHLRAIKLKAICTAGSGYDIKPDDPQKSDYQNDSEYIKLKEFLDDPNDDDEVFEDLMTNLACDYFLYGYCFLETVRGLGGELTEIYNLRSYNTFVKKKGQYPFYLQKGVNKEVTFKPFGKYKNSKTDAEAVMIKSYHPKTKYYGFPDWFSSTGDLVLDRSIVEHAIRNFENNLMLQFMIIVEGGELDAEGMKNMQKFLRGNYKGVSNAGKTIVLKSDSPDVKIKIEKLSEGVKESGFIGTREQSRDYILASHGIASILLGVKIKGQLGGTTEARDLFKIFNETVIRPEKRKFQKIINKTLREGLGINNFHIEFRDLKIETFKDMGILVELLVRSGLLEENEGRALLNFDPKDTDKDDDGIDDNEETDEEKKLEKIDLTIKRLATLIN